MEPKEELKFNRRFFDPAQGSEPRVQPDAPMETGDRPGRDVYVYTDKIVMAVNAALAAGRPLLVEGPPGSGKSSLALDVSRKLGWWYYERVVSSRSSAQDLLWEFDAIRRLNDAQAQATEVQDRDVYVEPGVLWWVFDPKGATKQGLKTRPPRGDPGQKWGEAQEAVLLLDEIDKADPDVPNDLLVPLGAGWFNVKETGARVQKSREFLLLITTNGERDLAPAFVRRCVRLKLEHPDTEQLVAIASRHFQGRSEPLYQPLAEWVVKNRQEAARRGSRQPSTAEFLDAIQACDKLGIGVGSSEWKTLSQLILSKLDEKLDASGGAA